MDKIGWKPGVESNLNIWNENWVNGHRPEPRDCILEPRFFHLGDLRVKDLLSPGGNWNAHLVNFLFNEDCARQILATPFCRSRIKDEVFWPLTDDGSYTVKSGYGIVFEEYMEDKGTWKDRSRINEKGKYFCKSKLWKLPGPSMWKILLWRIITNMLPIGKEFERRKIGETFRCGMCAGSEDYLETSEHLFRDCHISARIWAGSELGIRGESALGLNIGDWIINWVRFLLNLEEGEERVLKFMATLWQIWLLRNNVMFNGVKVDPLTLFRTLALSVQDCLKGLNLEEERWEKMQNNQVLGSMPRRKDAKELQAGRPFFVIGKQGQCRGTRVKVDASWEINLEEACGWVAYDRWGVEIHRGKRKWKAESALQAEALGLWEVCAWARDSTSADPDSTTRHVYLKMTFSIALLAVHNCINSLLY
ncbi:uncharacterized protein LOC141631924 [Silene latifolia]|uniref:uncharacterized protein LOC141631924 n=1 Tax=Silene latifolia TaxID=37657 RepID=UPI003D777833